MGDALGCPDASFLRGFAAAGPSASELAEAGRVDKQRSRRFRAGENVVIVNIGTWFRQVHTANDQHAGRCAVRALDLERGRKEDYSAGSRPRRSTP